MTKNIKISLIEENKGQIEGLPKNPRFIKNEKYKKLVKSIEENPEMLSLREILVYPFNDRYVIIGGNMRFRAIKELGYKEVPCKVISETATIEQLKAYTIKDNNGYGEWDFDLLANEWDFEDMDDWGVDLPDWEEEKETEIVEDEVPEVDETKEPTAKLGDIWQLGRHRLMCGDSTDKETVELLMNGNKAEICITSPPYGAGDNAHLRKKLSVGYGGTDGKTFYNQHKDDKSEWPSLMKSFFDVAQQFSLSQFVNVMMIGDNKKALIEWIYNNVQFLVDIICWNKHTCPPQIHENVLNNGYEFVFVFDNENGTRKIRFGDFRGTKSNYIETKKQQNEYADIHKAVFGTEFVQAILGINGKAKSVYEPFGGTGTTMIVCEQLDRTCYMMELDPKYCDVIIQRWENLTGEKAVKLN